MADHSSPPRAEAKGVKGTSSATTRPEPTESESSAHKVLDEVIGANSDFSGQLVVMSLSERLAGSVGHGMRL